MTIRGLETLPTPVAEVVTTAVGQAHREDPVRPRTGGPAGNARLTAWLGMLLLVAFVVECATLLSLHGLLSAHIFVGALLVPLALAKTATTVWRMLRYYFGNADYRSAGPPPLLLRLLGPLVVLTSLAVLGTGVALVAIGSGHRGSLGGFAGFRLDALTLHKAAFVLWLVVTSLHTLARLVPAMLLAGRRLGPRNVPGGGLRLATLALVVAVSIATGAVVLSLGGNYRSERDRGFDRRHDDGAACAQVHLGSAHIQDHSASLRITCDNARPAGNAGAVNVGAALA